MLTMLTGQFADKPTRGQSSRGLVNSQTRRQQYFISWRDDTIFFYTETKPYPNLNHIDCLKYSGV